MYKTRKGQVPMVIARFRATDAGGSSEVAAWH